MLLSEALQEFDLSLAGVALLSTRTWYRRRLRSLAGFLGDVDISTITTPDLRRWRVHLVEQDQRWMDHPTRPPVAGGLSVWTVRGYITACRRLFAWLADEGLLGHNPAARLEMPPKPSRATPKAISYQEVLAMIQAASVRDRAMVTFLAATGCRVGGLADLRLGDLEMEREPLRATVREKFRGGPRARIVYYGPLTAFFLLVWLAIRPDKFGTDHVFLGQRGPLTESGIHQALKRLGRRVGVTGRCNPHAFRHGFAKGYLDQGADLGTVSQLLGHGGIEVTSEFYSRWLPGELAERHQRFSWLERLVNSAGESVSLAQFFAPALPASVASVGKVHGE
jgi:site-specific recombinase XerD